jgi:hypothetical protein
MVVKGYMRPRYLHIPALILAALIAPTVAVAEGEPSFEFEGLPKWVPNLDGFSGKVTVTGLDFIVEITVAYTYPDGERGVATAQPTSDPDTFVFTIPPAPDSAPGELSFSAEALYGMHGTDLLTSDSQSLPVSYLEELDITGEAATTYLYPLGSDGYKVRYIPCCNIYGGLTVAERVPINPLETSEGLPERLLSDFVVLKPDGLSASTMGMYFDFALGPDAFSGITSGSPGLYEFDGRKWTEFQDYVVDVDAGTVLFHCPDGGEFVLAVKP